MVGGTFERWGSMRPSIGVALATTAALLICTCLIIWAYVHDFSRDEAARLQNASVVAQIIGVAALVLAVPGVFFLILEQRRIEREITRRPKLFVGFDSDRLPDGAAFAKGTERSVEAVFEERELYSSEISFYFVVVNTGERSARDLEWNIDFPKNVSIIEKQSGMFPRAYLYGADRSVIVVHQPHLHIDNAFRPTVYVKVPRGLSTVEFNVHVWYVDAPKMETTALRLNVIPRPSPPIPESTEKPRGTRRRGGPPTP